MTNPSSYVYCLVPGDVRLPSARDFSQIKGIRHGKVQAVVGPHPMAECQTTRCTQDLVALARIHHGIAQSLLACCTPIPLRIGTLFADEDRVRDFLRYRHDSLEFALAAVQQRHEWGLKLWVDSGALAQHIAEHDVSIRSIDVRMRESAEGTRYLLDKQRQRRLGEARQAWIGNASRALVRSLGPHGEKWATLVPYGGEAWNAAMLVRSSEEPAFLEEVRKRARELEALATLRISGPWPPYSFIPSPSIAA